MIVNGTVEVLSLQIQISVSNFFKTLSTSSNSFSLLGRPNLENFVEGRLARTNNQKVRKLKGPIQSHYKLMSLLNTNQIKLLIHASTNFQNSLIG